MAKKVHTKKDDKLVLACGRSNRASNLIIMCFQGFLCFKEMLSYNINFMVRNVFSNAFVSMKHTFIILSLAVDTTSR